MGFTVASLPMAKQVPVKHTPCKDPRTIQVCPSSLMGSLPSSYPTVQRQKESLWESSCIYEMLFLLLFCEVFFFVCLTDMTNYDQYDHCLRCHSSQVCTRERCTNCLRWWTNESRHTSTTWKCPWWRFTTKVSCTTRGSRLSDIFEKDFYISWRIFLAIYRHDQFSSD